MAKGAEKRPFIALFNLLSVFLSPLCGELKASLWEEIE